MFCQLQCKVFGCSYYVSVFNMREDESEIIYENMCKIINGRRGKKTVFLRRFI